MPATLQFYRDRFDAESAAAKSSLDSMAASGDGRTYYTFQYALEGTLSMFEACGDVKYLERVLAWGLKMVAAAKIVDNRGNKNWGKIWLSPYSPTKIAYQLDDFQGSTALAHLARIILTTPALKNEYGAEAQAIYNFVRDQIVNKHLFKRGGLSGLRSYYARLDICANDKPTLLVSILIDLVQASDALGGADNKTWNYPAILKDFASGLKDHFGTKTRFTPYKGGLIWDLNLPFEEPFVGMDTAHANRMPAALIDLVRTGNVFDRSYLQGLADLFTKVIWNGSLTSPMFTNGINGGNEPFRNRPPWNGGMIYSGWAKLSEFDATTFQVCDAVLRACLAGTQNPSLSYNNSSHGRIALAGFLAKAAAAVATPPPPPPPLPPSAPSVSVTSVSSNRVSLKWSSSSNATGYRVKRSSVSGGPYVRVGSDLPASAVMLDDNGLTPGTTYLYVVSAFNLAGESANSTEVRVTTSPVSNGNCVTVTGANVWFNRPFPEQGNVFTAEFDAIPAIGTIDAVIGLSIGSAGEYSNHACAVRFRATGIMDARNGSGYPVSAIKYVAGKSYHFRLVVNIPMHTYSIYVTPAGMGEVMIGSNFLFRTEQWAVSKLNNWSAVVAFSGSIQICNFKPDVATAPPPVITRVITVNSMNPESGVLIVVSPPDNSNTQDGPTSFTRTYNDKTSLTLTAPATALGNNFEKWQQNGVDASNVVIQTVTLDSSVTMTAVYVTPEPPPVDPHDDPDPPVVPDQPVLKFHIDGNHLVLEWDVPDFVLQSNPDINAPDGWTDYPGITTSPVSVEIASTGSLFFRLRWTGESGQSPETIASA